MTTRPAIHPRLAPVLDAAIVVPVIALDDVANAAPLAHALVAGGITVLELTLRTPVALDALRAMKAAAPHAHVGMGTVRTPQDAEAALAAGADFLVTPGTPPALARALIEMDAPVLPGAATPSEMMALADLGFAAQKLFPAEAVGGRALLQAVAGPLPDLVFCPTGGVTPQTAPAYLALPNVACVGGSWLAPASAVAAGAWADIEAKARVAAGLGGEPAAA